MLRNQLVNVSLAFLTVGVKLWAVERFTRRLYAAVRHERVERGAGLTMLPVFRLAKDILTVVLLKDIEQVSDALTEFRVHVFEFVL